MERGIYFDAWFKHNHCYHPSLPLRSVQNLEDLKRYHGTVLIWPVWEEEASAFPIWSVRPSGRWIPGCGSTDI